LIIKPRIYHAGLFLYCLLIFILSSFPGEDFPKVDFEFSDKIVHLIIYAVLYVLFFYSLKNQSKYVKLQKFALEYSVLFTSLYGATDELHQYFVTNRSCEFNDWLADTAGAIIMYFIMRKIILSRKSLITALLFIILTGCSGMDNSVQKNKPKIAIESIETWLDFMPVVGDPDKNRFGFLIRLKFTGRSLDTNYTISDLQINLNTEKLKNKKYNTGIENFTDTSYIMNVYQSYDEKYLDKNKEYPEEAEFSFKINKEGALIKTIATPKIKILKTQ